MKTVTRSEINDLLRRRQGRKSLRQFAESLDLSAAYLSDIYLGKRDPGPAILGLFGLRKRKTTTIIYEYLSK